MRQKRRIARAAGAWLALSVLTAAAATAAPQSGPPKPEDVVATVGDRQITLAEVDRRALELPASNFGSLTLSQAIYEARRAAIDEIVALQLVGKEAEARGVDEATLVTEEITGRIPPVSDTDIEAWYRANPDRVQGASLDQVRAPIRQLLTQERMQVVRDAFLERLKQKTPVQVLLDAPRVEVAADGRPATGPSDAPVELIEFSDFQCPFCHQAFPIVKRVMAEYDGRVRLVYRHYPLANHPRARPAAEAAACAAAQGHFWEYHDRLFENQDKLSDADLKAHAVAVGLDAARFDACFDATAHKAEIDADIDAGNAAGVTGTPAFFVNGRALSGAQPFEAFKRIIDEELERAAAR